MKKQIGRVLRRFQSVRRTHTSRLKFLNLESLEDRRLLAGDVINVPFPHHNDLIAEDVSGDYNVSAIDALLVINAINENQGGLLPEVEAGKKSDGPLLDTNGDNYLSAIDALKVINFLNGEGETTPTAVFSYELVDSTGQPISGNTVTVGDIFQLQAFVQDTRGFSATGINAAYLDIAYDNGDAFDVAVGEIQSLKFFVDQLAFDTTSSFTLTFDGQTTAPIGLFTAGGSPRSDTAIAAAMQDALEALPNIGAGNVSAIVDAAATSEDGENNVPRFNFEIRFGNELAGQNLPMVTLDATNVAVVSGGTFEFTIEEVLAGDQSTPAAEAQTITFDDLYNFARRREVTSAEFNDIGATSQQIPLPDPSQEKLLLTIPMIAIAPGVITFTPNEADSSPLTDIVSGVTVIPTSMVNFGAAFTVTVLADATAPTAANDSLSIAEDTSLTLGSNVTSNDTVTAPRTLSVFSVSTISGTTLGSVSGLVYTPPQDFVGTDVITYIAQDSTGLTSNVATVTITVTAVNDAPVAVDDPTAGDAASIASFTVEENSSGNALPVLANDNSGPGESDALTITAVGATTNGGQVSISGSNVIYTPAADFFGEDTFTYTIQDTGGLTDTATVTVTVEAGVLPRARNDSGSTAENTPLTLSITELLANDRVNDGATPVFISAADGSSGTVVVDTNGTPNDPSDDSLIYTPTDENFQGTDQFTYLMNDTVGTGENSTGTVSITVTDINDTPILNDDTASTTEDTATTIALSTLTNNDSPGLGENEGVAQVPQTLTVTSVSIDPSFGSVEIIGANVVYTPAADINGTATFTYTATDNGTTPSALSSTAVVTVSITAVNDNPIALSDLASTTEDTAVPIEVATLLANDTVGPATATDELSSQTVAFTGVSSTSSRGGVVSLSGTTITYTPPADFNDDFGLGSDTFTYTISDGAGGTATGTVAVSVTAVNDAPEVNQDGVADAAQTFKDIAVTFTVLTNDAAGPATAIDEAGQTLSVTNASSNDGSVRINSDSTLTFTPNSGFTGTTTITYTIADGEGGSGTGTALVTVEEFVPTTISGTIFVDETGDGVLNAAERRLGGIKVSISGTSLGQTFQSDTELTLSDGSYTFENLGPGQYVINVSVPRFMSDGLDIPGALGDSDSVENQFTINVNEPGGADASNYNFAVRGLDVNYARTLDQLASRYIVMNPSLAYNGVYFGLGADNSLLWSAQLDGYEDAIFTEAVLTANGNEVLMTYVDADHNVFTATLGRGEFIKTLDTSGNAIIRVLGDSSRFSWQQVDLSTPPFSATKYLDSVDSVFEQEGWN